MQKGKIFIHFTGFSIWNWDMDLGCRAFGIESPCLWNPSKYPSQKSGKHTQIKFDQFDIFNPQFSKRRPMFLVYTIVIAKIDR